MSRRSLPVSRDEILDLQIDRLAEGGRGVARHDGFVVFVQRGLPGDRVRARVTRVHRRHAEAIVEQVLDSGPGRVAAPCPFHGECGGCAWQAFDYDAQLAAKQAQVIEAITRLGGVDDPPVLPIIGAKETLGYRNKMEYAFWPIEHEDGSQTVGLGFHAAGRWDQVVPIDHCLIADPRGIPAHRTVLAWANRYAISVHDRESGNGLLRNLVVRVGRNTGEVLVHLVTAPGELPRAAELVDDLEVEVPGLVGVLHSTTASTAEVARGDAEPELLWGRDHFEEQLAGARLKVGALSFLQTNTAMAERMYELIAQVADLREDDIAYDLYCGIGSITLMLGRQVSHVVGVEVVEQAVQCAQENVRLNGLDNVELQVGNVRPVLKHAAGVWPDPTLVIVDPPRSGLVQKVVRRVCARRPERVVYVSCNPATFAANLPWFRENGYGLVSVQAVDQFPHTPHVELVARLEPIDGFDFTQVSGD